MGKEKTYGIKDAAKLMGGLTEFSARARFRKAGIKPKGTKHTWDSMKAMQAAVDKTSGPATKKDSGKKKAKSKKVAPKRKIKRTGEDAGAEA